MTHAMIRFAIIVSLFALTACSMSDAPQSSVYEVRGSTTERVAGVSAIITKHKSPQTAILDAYFVEEQTGDGVLGPSDFRAFCTLVIASEDVSQWTRILTPLEAMTEYNAPAQLRDWWIGRDTFASLQFYKPNILTGRVNGWIGVSQQTGRIYFYTFTM